jgi:hypothetical protein
VGTRIEVRDYLPPDIGTSPVGAPRIGRVWVGRDIAAGRVAGAG